MRYQELQVFSYPSIFLRVPRLGDYTAFAGAVARVLGQIPREHRAVLIRHWAQRPGAPYLEILHRPEFNESWAGFDMRKAAAYCEPTGLRVRFATDSLGTIPPRFWPCLIAHELAHSLQAAMGTLRWETETAADCIAVGWGFDILAWRASQQPAPATITVAPIPPPTITPPDSAPVRVVHQVPHAPTRMKLEAFLTRWHQANSGARRFLPIYGTARVY
jgi:hypothetical protein